MSKQNCRNHLFSWRIGILVFCLCDGPIHVIKDSVVMRGFWEIQYPWFPECEDVCAITSGEIWELEFGELGFGVFGTLDCLSVRWPRSRVSSQCSALHRGSWNLQRFMTFCRFSSTCVRQTAITFCSRSPTSTPTLGMLIWASSIWRSRYSYFPFQFE